MNLLNPLKIPHSVLFDLDGGRGRHSIINTLICNSENSFTYRIKAFPEDLEKFLEVEARKDKYGKPQHVMLQLLTENIANDRIEELKTFVNELIQT